MERLMNLGYSYLVFIGDKMKKIIRFVKKIRPYKGGGVALFQKDSSTGEYIIFLGKRAGELKTGMEKIKCCFNTIFNSKGKSIKEVSKEVIHILFSGRGKWSIPGGGYEEKDNGDLRQTAKREFYEETGLNLDSIVLNKEPYEHNMWFLFFTWKTLLYELKPDYKLNPNCIHRAKDGFEFSEAKQIPLSELQVLKNKHELNFGVDCEVKAFLRKIRK